MKLKATTEKILATGLVVLGYGAIIGLGVWRALKRGSTANSKTPPPGEPIEERPLQSLSLATPGDAPLDRLARMAAMEERYGGSIGVAQHQRAELDEISDSELVDRLLESQSLELPKVAGWSSARPDKLPIPTYAPAVMAMGIVIFAMGLATVWYVCMTGAIVFTIAAWRWVGELQGESDGN